MASRYATRPGKPSSSNSRHHGSGGYTTTNRNTNPSGSSPTYGGGRMKNNSSRGGGMPSDEDDENDSSDETTAFPMWKTVGVVAVVFGCFATVYPKMFHPMLLYVLGYGQQQNSVDEDIFPHPAMKHGAGYGPPRQSHFAGSSSGNDRQHSPFPGGSRGPMPGMGAGMGEVRSSKSVWHWMLPFYTIGIILFLLYTLSKILWKKPKKKGKSRRQRFNSEEDDPPEDFEEDDLDEDYDSGAPEDNDVASGPNGVGMDGRNLRGLQRRLRDTEQAMHEILSQLELLSTTADPVAADQIKKMTMDTLNDLGKLGAGRASSSSKQRQDPSDFGFTDARGKQRGTGGGSRYDSAEKRYMADLQKALADFKSFTENYIEEHSRKVPSSQAEASNELDQVQATSTDQDGGEVDVMESEKACSSEQLKVEKGEGTLTRLEEDEDTAEGAGGQEEETEEGVGDEDAANMIQQEPESDSRPVRRRKGRKRLRHEE